MESQTLARVLLTANVLPKHIQDLIGTNREDEAIHYASIRVSKYVKSKEVMARRDEIIENAKNDPELLTIVIFDEAHYSATSETAKGEDSAYSYLLNHFNSEDFPNIVVLMISATPFNPSACVKAEILRHHFSQSLNLDYAQKLRSLSRQMRWHMEYLQIF